MRFSACASGCPFTETASDALTGWFRLVAGCPFTETEPSMMSAAARRRDPAPPATRRFTSGMEGARDGGLLTME